MLFVVDLAVHLKLPSKDPYKRHTHGLAIIGCYERPWLVLFISMLDEHMPTMVQESQVGRV